MTMEPRIVPRLKLRRESVDEGVESWTCRFCSKPVFEQHIDSLVVENAVEDEQGRWLHGDCTPKATALARAVRDGDAPPSDPVASALKSSSTKRRKAG